MNLKSKIISLATIILLLVSGSAYSQGVFKSNLQKSTEESTTTTGGIFKAPGPGDGPGENAPGLESDMPIGEGLAILSLLSGGYFMLKKRNTKK